MRASQTRCNSTEPNEKTAKVTICKRVPGNAEILDRETISFLATLEKRYGERRRDLLAARKQWRAQFADKGYFETSEFNAIEPRPTPLNIDIVESDKAPRPPIVEYLAPVEEGALNLALASGADRVIFDFEDATSPDLETLLQGHLRLMEELSNPDPARPEIMVRVRGLHLEEAHLRVDDLAMSAAYFDFGCHVYHANLQRPFADAGHGSEWPIIFLPKLEHPDEAQLWADILRYTERRLGLAFGTLRIGLYVETLPALLQLEALIAPLKPYLCALTVGKWDFVFDWVKSMHMQAGFYLPDRSCINIETPLIQAYIGRILSVGDALNIPVSGGVANFVVEEKQPVPEMALKGRKDEASRGFVGAGVAHPGLVAPVRACFEAVQMHPKRDKPIIVQKSDLFQSLDGPQTLASAEQNLETLLRFTQSWLAGNGAPQINDKIVYLASIEIARTQLWVWLRDGVQMTTKTGDSRLCDVHWLNQSVAYFADMHNIDAKTQSLVIDLLTAPTLLAFFTDLAYPLLDRSTSPAAQG